MTNDTIKLSDYYLKIADWTTDKAALQQAISALETSISTCFH